MNTHWEWRYNSTHS